MAYIGNQLAQIASTLSVFGSPECEFTEDFYATSVDALATVLGVNYISDGQKRGLVLNSVVWVQTANGLFLCQVSALQANSAGYGVTLSQMAGNANGVALPSNQYTTGALSAATLTAAQIAGAAFVVLNNTSNTPGTQTLPAAAVLFAAIPNAQVGFSYLLRIVNNGTGTLTLAADVGATLAITGHAAILTLTWVEYIVTFTSAIAGTIVSIGAGDAP